ncbi:MAG: alpha/beta hydrolase [Candidatus Nanopelagicales bacterium]|jgi:pimeloyl-ACP methyl ester carboxylesterase|nr:alpha/beta hydrolase [Candidatus Nanopelagicales bacterium]
MSTHEEVMGIQQVEPAQLSPSVRVKAAVVAVVAVAAWALLAGWWTPRGPLTAATAIASIIISLGVGGLAGYLVRSRWAILWAPAVFVTVYELARLATDGPMVDGIHASMYGAIAFITGRGFQALLTLVPLALGAALGAGVSRKRRFVQSSTWSKVLGRTSAVAVALVLSVLTWGLARPASTAPIVGADGQPLAGSVAELTTIPAGQHDLHVMIRGHSLDNPVLLFLAGGPGGSEFGAMRRHLPELEQYFTVATWDQRGAGTAYAELDPTGTVTVDSYLSDTYEVTNYLRERFGQEDIYLLGQSWGTTLAVMAVQKRPELYRAFIGTGQMVSQLATDEIFYRDTLTWAEQTGNDALVAQLQEAGPPPYAQMFPYETALSHEQDVYAYDHSGNSEGSGQMSENLLVSEYTLIDQIHILGAFMDTFAAMYPQLQGVDFRNTATEFAVPVFFVQGAHEADGRAQPFAQWYPMIDAPSKDLIVLNNSGHRPLWEQPDEFVDYMVGTVLAQTT